MKERIVIEGKIDIKHLKELEKEHDEKFMSFPEYQTEQVPENFTELKDLCKGKFAEISEHSIMIFGMLDFFDDGTLTFHNYCEIANDLTLQQMWQIIKSLIGEE